MKTCGVYYGLLLSLVLGAQSQPTGRGEPITETSESAIRSLFKRSLPSSIQTLSSTYTGLQPLHSDRILDDVSCSSSVIDLKAHPLFNSTGNHLCPSVVRCTYDETRIPKTLHHVECRSDVDPLGMFVCQNMTYEVTLFERRSSDGGGQQWYKYKEAISTACTAIYANGTYKQLKNFLSVVPTPRRNDC